jgi:hypothetical protein
VSAFRCSDAALERDEPLFGTASAVRRWVLVEQPGPWGPAAPPAVRGDAAVTRSLRRQAAAQQARYLAVRRPRGGPRHEGRCVFLADSRVGHERLLRLVVPTEEALADVRLPDDTGDTGAPGAGWQVCTEPLVAVCTQGKHDTCCAIKGRPLAAALSAVAPDQVWECSHIGGDRFAPNVLVLPRGQYFGRIPPEQAADVLAALDAGLVPQRYYRGRSCFGTPVQAAQHFAARHLAAQHVPAWQHAAPADALAPLAVETDGPHSWRVQLAAPTGRLTVTVRRDADPVAALLTCHAEEPRHPPVFALVDLRSTPPSEE